MSHRITLGIPNDQAPFKRLGVSTMTTRYKTEAEKAGVKRRMAALRKRKNESGLRQYAFWLSAEDAEKVKQFIEGLGKKPD